MPLFAILIAAALLGGCSAANQMMGGNSVAEAEAKMQWPFARDAILIEVVADDYLNQFEGRPHTLMLGVFQVEKADAFVKLAADADALRAAMETGQAGKDVLSFNRYVVAPGARRILAVDRAENAKLVGLFAAYYGFELPREVRLFAVPVQVDSSGMLVKTRAAAPGVLGIRLVLGAAQLVAAEVVNQNAPVEVLSAGAEGPAKPRASGNTLSLQEIQQMTEQADSVRQLGNK